MESSIKLPTFLKPLLSETDSKDDFVQQKLDFVMYQELLSLIYSLSSVKNELGSDQQNSS